MQKVTIQCYGRLIIVDEDQVKKHLRKDKLVAEAKRLNDAVNNCSGLAREVLREQLNATMGKIIRLNRTIRQNVQFAA